MRKIYAILKKVFQPMGRILSTREWAIKKETKLLLNKFKNNFEKAFEESLNGATDIVPIHDLIAANTEGKTLEGEPFGNWTVLIKFPSEELAKSFMTSDAYAPLRKLRVNELTTGSKAVLFPAGISGL